MTEPLLVDRTRKRKADSLGRIAALSVTDAWTDDVLAPPVPSVRTTTGRGALAGWTRCPLCGRHSQKRFALGRGIATHLHAVHTPWKPGKVERNVRRRRV